MKRVGIHRADGGMLAELDCDQGASRDDFKFDERWKSSDSTSDTDAEPAEKKKAAEKKPDEKKKAVEKKKAAEKKKLPDVEYEKKKTAQFINKLAELHEVLLLAYDGTFF